MRPAAEAVALLEVTLVTRPDCLSAMLVEAAAADLRGVVAVLHLIRGAVGRRAVVVVMMLLGRELALLRGRLLRRERLTSPRTSHL